MTSLKNKIERKLKESGVEFEFIELPKDLPIDVAAHIRFHHIDAKKAVPTLIYRTENGFIAVQKRGDSRIDPKKLEEFAGVKRLSLANEEELRSLGTEPGIVPLLGVDVPYYMEQSVLDVPEIYGGGGEKDFALKMKSVDLRDINNSRVGDFAEMEYHSTMKQRVFSGVRANARIHLGNYMGAIKGMVELQDKYDCIFSIVDLHTIIVPYDPKLLQSQIKEAVLDFLGAGLDPKKCHLLIQSHLAPQHLELAYYLGCIYPVSRIQDLPTYKDKIANYPDYVNVGLFYYPVLMAADILIYNAPVIPVGIDNEPHLEVAREMARKFNSMYGTNFVEPQRYDTPGRSVPSLMGEGKMSKSKGGTILLTDTLEEIKATLAKTPTDSGSGEKFPQEGTLANLINMVELFQGRDRAQQYRQEYKVSGIQYSVLKEQLAQAIFAELEPIQERRKHFEDNPKLVAEILAEGKDYAKKIADETLAEVRGKMGLV